jgi:hypothetical protein
MTASEKNHVLQELLAASYAVGKAIQTMIEAEDLGHALSAKERAELRRIESAEKALGQAFEGLGGDDWLAKSINRTAVVQRLYGK